MVESPSREKIMADTAAAALRIEEMARLDCRPYARALAFLMGSDPQVGDTNLVHVLRDAAGVLERKNRVHASRVLVAAGVGLSHAQYAAWLLDGGLPVRPGGSETLPAPGEVEPVGSVGD